MNCVLPTRRAAVSDRDAVISLINSVWTDDDISRRSPWLFTEERISDHLICERDGGIRAVVGAYPYEVRLSGRIFRMLGVGQVITQPEYRGQGMMSSLLSEVTRILDEEEYDGSWLWGDRIRYGRFGWGTAGRSVDLTIDTRHLPDVDGVPGARQLSVEDDFELIRDHIARLPDAVIMPDEMLKQRLGLEGVGGWVLEDTFVLLNRERDGIVFAEGDPEKIRLLLKQQTIAGGTQTGDPQVLRAKLPALPTPLMAACRDICSSIAIGHTCGFRIGRMLPFLEKLLQGRRARWAMGSGVLGIHNTDTAESVTLRMDDGLVFVEEGAGAGAVCLSRRSIGELLFGLLSPELYDSSLGASSAFRSLLPLNLHIPAILQNVV